MVFILSSGETQNKIENKFWLSASTQNKLNLNNYITYINVCRRPKMNVSSYIYKLNYWNVNDLSSIAMHGAYIASPLQCQLCIECCDLTMYGTYIISPLQCQLCTGCCDLTMYGTYIISPLQWHSTLYRVLWPYHVWNLHNKSSAVPALYRVLWPYHVWNLHNKSSAVPALYRVPWPIAYHVWNLHNKSSAVPALYRVPWPSRMASTAIFDTSLWEHISTFID